VDFNLSLKNGINFYYSSIIFDLLSFKTNVERGIKAI